MRTSARAASLLFAVGFAAQLEAAPLPPAQPVQLFAAPASTNRVRLQWLDTARDESGFRVEKKSPGGAFQLVKTVGANVQATTIAGLAAGTFFEFRVRAINRAFQSPPSNTASAFTDLLVASGICFPTPNRLCLGQERFSVQVDFRTAPTGPTQIAVGEEVRPDAGLFWFFQADNVDLIVKVVNACATSQPRYWVFASSLTNVEYTIQVTDTRAGRRRAYFNPLGRNAPPIQDTSAFATCP